MYFYDDGERLYGALGAVFRGREWIQGWELEPLWGLEEPDGLATGCDAISLTLSDFHTINLLFLTYL